MEPSHPSSVSDSDLLVMILLGGLLVGGAGTAAVVLWHTVVAWCLGHGFLVSAGESPLLRVPNTGGAGLDLARLAIVAALVLVALALAAHTARRALRSRDLQ